MYPSHSPLSHYSHGVRAPIPQTQGVLIEQEAVPSKNESYKVIIMVVCIVCYFRTNISEAEATYVCF